MKNNVVQFPQRPTGELLRAEMRKIIQDYGFQAKNPDEEKIAKCDHIMILRIDYRTGDEIVECAACGLTNVYNNLVGTVEYDDITYTPQYFFEMINLFKKYGHLNWIEELNGLDGISAYYLYRRVIGELKSPSKEMIVNKMVEYKKLMYPEIKRPQPKM